MTTIDDVALAAIAVNVGARLEDSSKRPTFDETLSVVQKLRDNVILDVASTTGPIARHHLYDDVGGKVLHCMYERVCGAASLAFYVSGDFTAEPTSAVTLDFVGSYPTSRPHVN